MGEHDSAVPIVDMALRLNDVRRSFTRIPLHAKALLLVNDQIVHCEVMNIGLYGAYVTLDPPLEMNASVRLTILGTPTSGTLSDIKARVVRVTSNGVGLQFE